MKTKYTPTLRENYENQYLRLAADANQEISPTFALWDIKTLITNINVLLRLNRVIPFTKQEITKICQKLKI